jgi:hydroxyethylthiazole kinase-like uncharacterized protein yjeF
MRLDGSCHCGAVRFSVESHAPYPYQRCYCSICRKTSGGGGYAVNIGGDARTLVVEGADALSTYRAMLERDGATQESGHCRYFCRACGSPLYAIHDRWPDLVHPVASAIDSELAPPPEYVHVMVGSKAPWVEVEGRPGDRQFDAYPEESLADWHDARGLSAGDRIFWSPHAIPWFGDGTSPPPSVTRAEMAQIDEWMMHELGVRLRMTVENAGRDLATLARQRFFGGDVANRVIALVAGFGGNGGGALVAARRLHTWGAKVRVWIADDPECYGGLPGEHLTAIERMGVPVYLWRGDAAKTPPPELVVDGLVGYTLDEAPHGTIANMIRETNKCECPILALDVPSGLDATTGEPHAPCVRAAATLTLAMPKRGLLTESARDHVGELYVGDVSVPPAAWKRFGIDANSLFSRGDLVRVR